MTSRLSLRAALLALVVAASFAPREVAAALPRARRTVLEAYLTALARARYDAAFALLDAGERHYFGTVRNYASGYEAERFTLASYRVVGSESSATGSVALVSEHVRFYDYARDASATAVVKAPYGIVATRAGAAIHDPGHPWRATVPAGAVAASGGLRATVRKVSFFTGRVEFVITFENRGSRTVTLLPYGRSVLRDSAGAVYRPIAVRAASLTDAELYLGLRLPSSARYAGFLTFATPRRFLARSVRLSLAPILADGGNAPFELVFAPIPLPLP